MSQGVKGTGSKAERSRRWNEKHPGAQLKATRSWRAKHPGYLGPKRQALVDRINTIKESTPCKDCDTKFPACCMDFDHKGADKYEEVGKMVSRTRAWQLIEAEIAKCDLVCANCHRIRTRDKGCSGWARRRA